MDDGSLTITAAATGITAGSAFMAYAVRGKSSQIFAPSIYHSDRKRRVISLTFDDGPSESTPLLLEVLARHNVRASFFMCGRNVRRCPAIAREVLAAGHEIGNHTDSHPQFYFKSPSFIYGEMAVAQETIHATLRITPRMFRAPYGVRWPGLRRAQERLNLHGVMWTAIGRDWKWPASRIVQVLVRHAANGAIFCLHDGREVQRTPDISSTIEAVDHVIPVLKDLGFAFEPVLEACGGLPEKRPRSNW